MQLNLADKKATEAGVAELKKALPDRHADATGTIPLQLTGRRRR